MVSPRRIVQFDSHWLPLNTRGRWQRVEIDLGVAQKRLEDQWLIGIGKSEWTEDGGVKIQWQAHLVLVVRPMTSYNFTAQYTGNRQKDKQEDKHALTHARLQFRKAIKRPRAETSQSVSLDGANKQTKRTQALGLKGPLYVVCVGQRQPFPQTQKHYPYLSTPLPVLSIPGFLSNRHDLMKKSSEKNLFA